MLFNSYPFLFAFLPVVLAGSFVLANRCNKFVAPWLTVASLLFYGWWDFRHIPVLLCSIALNYCAGELMLRRNGKAGGRSGCILGVAIGGNLCVLGYFKYAGFLTMNVGTLFDLDLKPLAIVLPLGISFFTFTQIAYLVDVYRTPTHYGFVHYALFVTYFPHLIAGPILHHREMMPQFQSRFSSRLHSADLAPGITLLAIGLFKKTVLADGIAPYAAPVFEQVPLGYAPGFLEAWGATLAFGLQLYFDFSAYSDMAVGLSKMFGIRMPMNFSSPYKATSIIDFWRRWHITLSRFLRDYLYFALGGNRKGLFRRHANLIITMLLGGLWHGASWTFVFWGGLHGVYLVINHAWRALRKKLRIMPEWLGRIGKVVGALLTFVAVFAAWVFFRAEDLPSAFSILRGMAGLNGNAVPPAWLIGIGEFSRWIARLNLGLPHDVNQWIVVQLASIDAHVPRGLADERNAGVLISRAQVLWIIALLAVVWSAPNTRQIMSHSASFLEDAGLPRQRSTLAWQRDRGWAIATALLMVAAVASMGEISEFLYFQF